MSQRKSAQEERNKGTIKQPENKMALVNSYLSIITLIVDRLNSLLKRHRIDGWIQKEDLKQDLTIYYLQKSHFSFKDTHILKVKG